MGRVFTLLLLLLLAGLQYHLWSGKNGINDYRAMSERVVRQQADNQLLKERNDLIYKEIADLTDGIAAIEELARNDLGYIKRDETFYRIIPKEAEASAVGDDLED